MYFNPDLSDWFIAIPATPSKLIHSLHSGFITSMSVRSSETAEP